MAFVINDAVCEAGTCLVEGGGEFSLSGAIPGYLGFDDVCDPGSVVNYEAHSVDASGARTGSFETGVGEYVLDGATRKIVGLQSDEYRLAGFANGTSVAVSLTVRARLIEKTIPAFRGVTVYVRSDGDDANSGFYDTAAGALLTIQAALDLALSGDAVAIWVGPGVFPDAWIARVPPGRSVEIVGDGAGVTTLGGAGTVEGGGSFGIFDLSIGASAGHALVGRGSGTVIEMTGLEFLACGMSHIRAEDAARVLVYSAEIAGDAQAHFDVGSFAKIIVKGTESLTANVAFSAGYAVCLDGCGYVRAVAAEGADFVPGAFSCTGHRFDLRGNGVIFTAGAASDILPGSVAGVTSSGGQYL